MKTGKVYLVGAGPGDPGLITRRGEELISRADVIIHDDLLDKRLLDSFPPGVEIIYAGKRRGSHPVPQELINSLLIEKARQGKTVIRLKGGDPFLCPRCQLGDSRARLCRNPRHPPQGRLHFYRDHRA